jgi:hypothetical protein
VPKRQLRWLEHKMFDGNEKHLPKPRKNDVKQLFHTVRRRTRPSAPHVHSAPPSSTISVTPKCASEVDPE